MLILEGLLGAKIAYALPCFDDEGASKAQCSVLKTLNACACEWSKEGLKQKQQ
jgi:hypothetical protein